MTEIPKSELFSILHQYNPWWNQKSIPDLPTWKRAPFTELFNWIKNPPVHRALILSGARQIGKTTLMLQAIETLIQQGVPPSNILYATFDHPLLKWIGLNGLIELWQESEIKTASTCYLFLDEIQYTSDWTVWLKHQVDFFKNRRIIVTGSATPLTTKNQESGVGRWHTIKLPTLSFYEYLQIKKIESIALPDINSLKQLLDWPENNFIKLSQQAKSLTAYFHDYLLKGGFPQTANMESLYTAQKLLREDIVDKVLKRDMTALYGVRQVPELERAFLYLCMNDGASVNISSMSSKLGVSAPTVNRFIEQFEAAHLIYRLYPYQSGKEILKGKYKIYLTDPAIAPSVLLRGKSLLEDNTRMGMAVETAFFKHLFARYYQRAISFSYWKRKYEVDFIAQMDTEEIPFEVKYRSEKTGAGELRGILDFCREKKLNRGYVITKEMNDFSILDEKNIRLLKIPAPLACYWLSKTEIDDSAAENHTETYFQTS